MIPHRFLDHIADLLSDESDQQEFSLAASRPLPKTLRVNTKKISLKQWRNIAEELEVEAQPLPLPDTGYQVKKNLGRLLEHRLGLVYLQEFASMIPVEVMRRLAPNAKTVLDMCAAPGSKTTQMAGVFSADTTIVANDPAGSRLKVLAANLLRCGSSQVICTQIDGREFGQLSPEFFDAILVDAPCSGEGTMRKDRHALRGWNRKRLKKLAPVQRDLVQSALAATKPGGLVVYSTCALSPEENHEIVKQAVVKNPCDVEVINLARLVPELERSLTPEGFLWVAPHHYDSGGFFVAALRKMGEGDQEQKTQLSQHIEPKAEDLKTAIKEQFDIEFDPLLGEFVKRNETYYFAPLPFFELRENLTTNRPGYKVGNIIDGELVPDQELALIRGHEFKKNVIEVDRDTARHFLYGGEIAPPAQLQPKQTTLIRYLGFPVGFARLSGSRFHNLLGPAFVQQSVE